MKKESITGLSKELIEQINGGASESDVIQLLSEHINIELSELKNQRNEMLEMLERLKKFYDIKAIHEDEYQLRYEIEQLIKKVKNEN
jgi:hypothetical protein